MRSSRLVDWRVVDSVKACRHRQRQGLRQRRRVFLCWQALMLIALTTLASVSVAGPACLVGVPDTVANATAGGGQEGVVRALLALGFIALILWSLFKGDLGEQRDR